MFIKEVKQLSKQIRPDATIIAVQKPPLKVGQFFKNKDKVPNNMHSGIVYRIDCLTCKASYIGQTRRQMQTRLTEHELTKLEQLQQQLQKTLSRSARIAIKEQRAYKEANESTEDETTIETNTESDSTTSTPHSTTIPIIDLTLSPEHSIINKSNVRTDTRLRLNSSNFNHSQLKHYKTFEQQVNQHHSDTNSTIAMYSLPPIRLIIYCATNKRARENLLIEEIDNLIRQLMNGPYHYSP
ncbi:unnamed protein product [Adineta steineri]|uniref:GIY-YIG domain-containing protein n=1 Tax=Adineta steineri TaxID=433720 RepID=A0A815BMR7_9BILA|nr:unnamed protein product [Adineta steineri]